MTEKIEYRESYRGPRKVPAAVVFTEFERVRAFGDLTGRTGLEALRPVESPAHDEVEWDDKIAAEEHRLTQVRQLIRSVVRVRVEEGERSATPPEIRHVYVHVPDRVGREGKYEPPELLADRLDEYERALMEARRHWESAEQSFHELRRLAESRGGKAEALAIAIQGFAAVRQALELLRSGV